MDEDFSRSHELCHVSFIYRVEYIEEKNNWRKSKKYNLNFSRLKTHS